MDKENTPGKVLPDQTTRLSAILRRPEGLFAVLGKRRAAFAPPKPPKEVKKEAGCAGTPEEACPYEEEVAPLGDVSNTLAPGKESLLHSWRTLGSVDALNGEAMACVLHVLNETVADPCADPGDASALVIDEPPLSHRPTAAHPRAYRGTKYKPPKQPKAAHVDLRPYLCSGLDPGPLLARLDPFFKEAVALLERSFPAPEPQPAEVQDPVPSHERWRRPEYRKRIASLPAQFQRSLLWNLRNCDWEVIAAALSAYWALDLERDDSLRRCVSALLSFQPVKQMIDWCDVVSRMPSARRVHFTELLIESGSYSTAPAREIVPGLVRADSLSGDAVYRHRMFYALRSAGQRCSLNYANDGFLLANEYCENWTFEEIGALDGVAAAVGPFAEYAFAAEDWRRWAAMRLWERCLALEGFKELLEGLNWRNLDPQSASGFFTHLGDIVYEELGEKELKEKWRCIRERAGLMLKAVEEVPLDYRTKILEGLGCILWNWDDAEKLGTVLEPFSRLLKRLCSPPFKKHVFGVNPLTAFTPLPEEEWSDIQRAEDASFHKFESATARKNDSSLIGKGLWSLCEMYPRLASAGFIRYPRRLLKTARVLGVLSFPIRREIIESFTGHPLATADVTALTAEELAALVQQHIRPGAVNPISRRLQEHLDGKRPMRPAQIGRAVALARRTWLAFQLDVLHQIVLDRISAGMPQVERTSRVQHAFMMQQAAEEHRRSLRRLLKAYLSGRSDYAEQHPRNQEWLSRHPKIDPDKWIHGISRTGETAAHGVLTLSIERDALEVLRLGSYFGTCLGIGGGLSYSAAAVTLDINKQVVYARDILGRVVARQLLAISEDEILICFSVYPISSSIETRSLFKEYDLRLAAHLGIAIFQGYNDDDASYEIASTVSSNFWDDCAWDLNVEDQ